MAVGSGTASAFTRASFWLSIGNLASNWARFLTLWLRQHSLDCQRDHAVHDSASNTQFRGITIGEDRRLTFMDEITTLTSKGQVTVPKAIRDKLGLRPFDKIRFTIEDDEVKLKKAYPSLEDIAGSLRAPHAVVDIDEAIALAWEEHALESYRKMHEE
jgi:AbrB family looped-hinge helix DNA binding protein